MTRFIARRLVETLVVLFVMSICIYGLIGLMPGDPIDLMLGSDPHLTSADVARLKALMGIDQPLVKRYAAWATAALSGDLGYSRLYVRPALAARPCDRPRLLRQRLSAELLDRTDADPGVRGEFGLASRRRHRRCRGRRIS